ncbi:MAG: asparagine synthetase B, partial [Erysipelotrichaceae bacterium]|nr:asparagine synthetase B [Erysipelotrichaceae bacterium]
MCGIGGTIDFARDTRELRPIGLAMAQALAPRGPDDGGIYLDRSAMLVHRRLTVIDPIGGRQPMQSPDGNIILIYNGELYNTEDIRNDLITNGHQFEGHSDTEVVLHAFWEWGESAFERFNGIYALALWNRTQHRLTLCRDRLGVKPLFYAQRGSTLIFGSELKTLFCHPDVKPEIDEDGLRSVLLLGPARTPGDGVFRNVREVLPGHIVTFDREGLHDHAYWQLKAAPHYENEAETIAYTRALIEDAAHRQMVSDVPLCTFLSDEGTGHV